MEYILLTISFIFILMGILGSFLPVLPGPPLSWIGLLLLYIVKGIETNYWLLGLSFIATLIIVLLDYIIPAQGTKRFGGSKYGIWGTNIGLIVGILTPLPGGFIIGPFIGALVGELLFDRTNIQRAFKAATGSLLGFLVSTFSKFLLCMIFLGIYLKVAWDYRSIWF